MFVTSINKYERNDNGSYRIIQEDPKLGKMSGTMLGGIMNESMWDTPFSIAQRLLRIYSENADSPAMRQGKYLEPVILNYLNASGRLQNTPAEVLFPGYEEGDHLEWKSHFDDPMFAGHIDAIAGRVEDARQGIGIVECKTTIHPEMWDWENSIPPKHYWLQASLYAHFFGYSDIYFVVGILTSEEQANPTIFQPREDNVRMMKVGLYPEFDVALEYARDWYASYIQNGRTPVPNTKCDRDNAIITILDQQISTQDQILPLLHEYVRLSAEQSAIEKQTKALKEQITAFLDANGLDGIEDQTARYTYREQSRSIVDTDQMKQDGIYDHYVKKSTSKIFRKASR